MVSSKEGHQLIQSVAVASVVAATAMGFALAGGGFLRQGPGSPSVVDLSREVRDSCTKSKENRVSGGPTLKVLYSPGLDTLADRVLVMMEQVRATLVTELGIEFTTSTRLYLVQLDSYPESMKVVDTAPGTPAWVFLRMSASDSEQMLAAQKEVYGSLPHEWSHAVFDERYGTKSRLWKSRWITEGVASYAQYVVQRRLASESFDEWRRYLLPYFNLEVTSLEALLDWATPRKFHSDKALEEFRFYGAALGLFLRVSESRGLPSLYALLELLKDERRIRKEELQTALTKVTGHRYEELARISRDDREAIFREALAALDGPGQSTRLYGLAVLGKLTDWTDRFRESVKSLLDSPDVDEGVRAAARELLARCDDSVRTPSAQHPH